MAAASAFPARLRYVREIVGVFVISAFLLVIAALVLAPQTLRMFIPTAHFTIRLPAEGSLGLRRGADVLVMGTVVGSVNEISVDDAGNMDADVSVRGNFSRFIRSDSKAIIRKPLGIGDTMVEISRGRTALPPVKGVIQASSDQAPSELIDETLRDVRNEALPALHEMRGAIAEYTALAQELRERQAQFGQTLDHLDSIADAAQHGHGLAPMILNDPKLADDVLSVVANLRKAVDQLDQELSQTSPTVLSMSKSAMELPGVLLQAQDALRQVQRLAQVAQRSWLMAGAGKGQPDERDELGADQAGAGR